MAERSVCRVKFLSRTMYSASALPPGPSTDLVHTADSRSFSSPISSIPDDDAPSPIAADQPREKHEATLLVLMSKAWDAASYIDSHLSRETQAHVRVRENAFSQAVAESVLVAEPIC